MLAELDAWPDTGYKKAIANSIEIEGERGKVVGLKHYLGGWQHPVPPEIRPNKNPSNQKSVQSKIRPIRNLSHQKSV